MAATKGATSSVLVDDMQRVTALAIEPSAQRYGPPAKIAAPTIFDEKATWNWTAMKPPDESPDVEVSPRAMVSAGTPVGVIERATARASSGASFRALHATSAAKPAASIARVTVE
ncbi:MAG: hypothetical protein U0235_17245 [Polyangiaceae bacterium]